MAKRREKWRIETKVRLQSNRYVLFLESNDDEVINRLSLSFSLSSLSPRTQRQQQNRRWSISWRRIQRSFQSCRKRKARECSSLDVAEATRWKRSVRRFFDSENIVGLEVSETARNACEAYQSENKSKAKCVVEDFFTHDDKYDVIYDCTFLCAIQPTQRHVWAEQMRNLTKKGSRVISLVFPLGDFKGGPPFALSPELVKSLLQNDFDVEELIQVPEDMWARGRPEYLYVFIRK